MAESLYLKGKLSIMPASEPAALTSLQATENGDYTPPAGYDGFNEVNVNVPAIPAQFTNLSVTSNGDYTPPAGYDGFDEVNVNVPQSAARLTGLAATANGDYTPPTGYDGFDEVNVNVPGPAVDRLETSINHNGIFNVTENKPYGVDYYDPVIITVDVPEPVLIPKLITQNGVYLASDENADGFSNVTVNVSSLPSDCIIVENEKICSATAPITINLSTPLIANEAYLISIKDSNYSNNPSMNFKQYFRDQEFWVFVNKAATDGFNLRFYQNSLSCGSLSSYRDIWISVYKVPANFYCTGGGSNE